MSQTRGRFVVSPYVSFMRGFGGFGATDYALCTHISTSALYCIQIRTACPFLTPEDDHYAVAHQIGMHGEPARRCGSPMGDIPY